jgi:hypothetical protein
MTVPRPIVWCPNCGRDYYFCPCDAEPSVDDDTDDDSPDDSHLCDPPEEDDPPDSSLEATDEPWPEADAILDELDPHHE